MTEFIPNPTPEATPPDSPTRPTFDFESLTLWQALWLFLYRPGRVASEFWQVITEQEAPKVRRADSSILYDAPLGNEFVSSDMPYTPMIDQAGRSLPEQQAALRAAVARADARYRTNDLTLPEPPEWAKNLRFGQYLAVEKNSFVQVCLLLVAFFFSLIGMGLLRSSAIDPIKRAAGDTNGALFWLFLGGTIALVAAGLQWRNRSTTTQTIVIEDKPSETNPADSPLQSTLHFFNRHSLRFALVPVATLFAWFAYDKNAALTPTGSVEAIFTRSGVIAWVMATLLWFVIFAVDVNKIVLKLIARTSNPQPKPVTSHRRKLQFRWAYVGLILIFLVASYFRLHNLDGVPPEMTSDHIEKLRDAYRVDQGYYGIFFENNEGREGFQMYLVAVIGDWFGVGFNFRALKYATILEGLLAVLLAYWFGKEVIGRETREQQALGDWVGLAMAALLAISSWHTMLSRLGLRIALTPLTTLIVVIFLVRAVRYNRRMDFVLMGVTLGAGTYFYQANRMLPILVVPIVLLTALARLKINWKITARYIVNLTTAAVIAWVIYLPMYRYSVENPDAFWKRTYGRLLGDCERGPNANPEYCDPSTGVLLKFIVNHRDVLWDNYVSAFKMYSWQGDGMWILNGDGYPALDAVTNALLVMGLVMWVILIIKRRDIALLAIPLGVIVMLLPSTLALTQVTENPSFTRTSGTIPFIFLMAAYPLGLIAYETTKAGYAQRPFIASSALIVALFIGLAAPSNYDTFFNVYRESYETRWKPYTQMAAPLRDFAETRGSYGNAFYVHTDNWLDHRILGTVAGDFSWPNGLLKAEDVYQQIVMNQGTAHQYDPTKPLFFIINKVNVAGLEWLQTYFPGGEVREIQVKFNNNYYVYEVPAGWQWLIIRVTEQTARWSCITNCLPGPK
ncbi:MAG: hypothetical protein HY862_17135 [Chloroflexi bacterium]|nr:hypothetical protein [Chloroflexota bacterium]